MFTDREMDVSLKNRLMVKPAEPTWTGCQPLTEWDQIGSVSHVPTIYFYKPPEDWLTPPEKITNALIRSLSRALVHFYPLAGRLRCLGGGRLALDCNAFGAELVEAESEFRLDDLRHGTASPEFRSLVPRVDCDDRPIHEIPVLVVQVTRFSCGGVGLCISTSHLVVDGKSSSHFASEWARLARGEPLLSPPLLDRKAWGAAANSGPPRPLEHAHPLCTIGGKTGGGGGGDEEERNNEIRVETFKMTKHQVDMLKSMTNEGRNGGGGRGYTRYEVVTGHLWRCVCKARNYKSKRQTAIGLCIDFRSRMQPSLHHNYFGNAVVDVIAAAPSGELVSRPLGYAASRVREAINRVNNEYVNSSTNFLKNQSDLSSFQGLKALESDPKTFYGDLDLGVTSWLSLPIYDLNFGWGKVVYGGPGPATDDFDGETLILPSSDGDGSLMVILWLQVAHMVDFKKLFYNEIISSRI